MVEVHPDGLTYLGGGIECKAYLREDGSVAKFYRSEEERDYAMSLQRAASWIDIGPPVRGTCENADWWEKPICKGFYYVRMSDAGQYGYVSECASTVEGFGDGEAVGGIEPEEIGYGDRCDMQNQLYRLTGISAHDDHDGNVGMYDGHPVIIDFGRMSTSESSDDLDRCCSDEATY